MNRYVFLNPDGTEDLHLLVIVEAPTGVTYQNQCVGLSTEIREAEGFLVPIGQKEIAYRISRFFIEEFHGWSSPRDADWTPKRKARLRELVSGIPCWFTSENEADDRRDFLKLDETRFHECTEGWVPVDTPYGRGVLVFKNSD